MKTICYKVVRAGMYGRLYSSSVLGVHTLRYFKTKWTKPKVGGILVFDDLVKALNYGFSDDIVYECECRKPLKLPAYRFWLLSLNTASTEQVAKLWRIRRYKCMNLCATTEGWPSGTLAFREIKLTKLLKGPV